MPLHDGDREDRQDAAAQAALEEGSLERHRRLLAGAHELATGLDAGHREYAEQIASLIGADKVEANRGRYKSLKQQIAEIPLRYHPTPQGQAEGTARRKALAAQVHALYHEVGLDARRGIELRRRRQAALSAAIDRFIELDQMESRFAKEVPEPSSNPWIQAVPPFAYSWTWHSGTGSTSNWNVTAASAKTGQLNLYSSLHVHHPWCNEDEWVILHNMAEVGFWYTMPGTGRPTVITELRNVKTLYTGCLLDESGCSDGRARQLTDAYVITWSPQHSWGKEAFIPVHYIDYNTDDDYCWSTVHPHAVIKKGLPSNEIYPGGTKVLVVVGVRNFHHFDVDDMSCHGTMDTEFVLDRAYANYIPD